MPRSSLPVIQYWHSLEESPAYLDEQFASFRDLNPGMQHMIFGETEADAFIARHFSRREVAAFRACSVPAMQADYFRYCAVLMLGGVYSDVDNTCVAPLDPLLQGSSPNRLFRRGRERSTINHFFAFGRRRHPLLGITLEIATRNIEDRVPGGVWFTTGPVIFSCLVRLLEFDSIESFQRNAASSHGAALEPTIRSLSRTVRDRTQVAAAFRDVDVSPTSHLKRWLAKPSGETLPYKTTSDHWQRWQGPIYRPQTTESPSGTDGHGRVT